MPLFVIFTPLLCGCGRDSTPPRAAGPLKIVATTGMIADAVRQIGGAFVEVDCLMGPGIDPHRFSPSAGDLHRLGRAQMIFYNGLHLEGKMTDILEEGSRNRRVKAIAVTSRLDPMKDLRSTEGADGTHDPHVWFNVRLWMKCVEVVCEELVAADPAHATDFQANATKYLAELAKLDEEVKAKANTLPAKKRVLVTSHDAFGYFGAEYGFEVHGLQGVSTAAETTTKDVQDLAKLLGERRIPAVFGETSVPPKGLQAVLDSVREKYNLEVKLIGGDHSLYSDALGVTGSPGESYIGMVRHNITVIVDALGK